MPPKAAHTAVAAQHAELGHAQQVPQARRADLAVGRHERQHSVIAGLQQSGASRLIQRHAPERRQVPRVPRHLVPPALIRDSVVVERLEQSVRGRDIDMPKRRRNLCLS